MDKFQEDEFENPNKENQGPQDNANRVPPSGRPPLQDITSILYPKKQRMSKRIDVNLDFRTVQLR